MRIDTPRQRNERQRAAAARQRASTDRKAESAGFRLAERYNDRITSRIHPAEMSKMLTVEYLLIVEKAGTFCDSENAFKRLLGVDSAITIEGGRLRHDVFECGYAITSGEIEGKDERFFHLELTSDATDASSFENFAALLKQVKSILGRTNLRPTTLWDDVSFEYSRQGYDLIYRIENLMRKLIANFMLVKIGKHWGKETSLKEVISKSKPKEEPEPEDELHALDFIELKDVLLRPYPTTKDSDIVAKLKKATTEELATVQGMVPKSDWERYFANLVECDDTYIKARWDELYILRCKIAHNRFIPKSDLDRISTLVSEVKAKLDVAIKKLPQVQVPPDEVKEVERNAIRFMTPAKSFFQIDPNMGGALIGSGHGVSWASGVFAQPQFYVPVRICNECDQLFAMSVGESDEDYRCQNCGRHFCLGCWPRLDSTKPRGLCPECLAASESVKVVAD